MSDFEPPTPELEKFAVLLDIAEGYIDNECYLCLKGLFKPLDDEEKREFGGLLYELLQLRFRSPEVRAAWHDLKKQVDAIGDHDD